MVVYLFKDLLHLRHRVPWGEQVRDLKKNSLEIKVAKGELFFFFACHDEVSGLEHAHDRRNGRPG